jgi:hypothetical protein
MRLIHTAKFEKDYAGAPTDVQKAFDKQERFLADNLQHPSLHAKKYDESTGLWQASHRSHPDLGADTVALEPRETPRGSAAASRRRLDGQ